MTLQKYVSAEEGGGMSVTVDRDIPSSWETFRVRCLTDFRMLVLQLFLGFHVLMSLPVNYLLFGTSCMFSILSFCNNLLLFLNICKYKTI